MFVVLGWGFQTSEIVQSACCLATIQPSRGWCCRAIIPGYTLRTAVLFACVLVGVCQLIQHPEGGSVGLRGAQCQPCETLAVPNPKLLKGFQL
jgi:hypothetical protein